MPTRLGGQAAVSAILILLSGNGLLAGQENAASALDLLVTPAEKEFLLSELARIEPPSRFVDLSEYGERQLRLGGGFYGMLPDQLSDPVSLPLPTGERGPFAAALALARQREANRQALGAVNPDYADAFHGQTLSAYLDRLDFAGSTDSPSAADLGVHLDLTAYTGFFAALRDGEVTSEEAGRLAALPSNQAMLKHRRELGYVPEPLPTTSSLAEMIRMAGSPDPLDRLWIWINSQNAFDYADLVQNADGYLNLVAELEAQGGRIERTVTDRIRAYSPPGTKLQVRFAFTVGWAIRGWATPDMVGLNLEHVKDDWSFLLGTMVEEVYHRLQLQLIPTPSGSPATEFSHLMAADTGDPRYDRLYECIAYTVAEGAANRVRGPLASVDLSQKVSSGSELFAKFVEDVVRRGNLDAADALISEGLQGNGPLYGLGWKLAALIEEQDGPEAVGALQTLGPVQFFRHGLEIAAERRETLLPPEAAKAVIELSNMIQGHSPKDPRSR